MCGCTSAGSHHVGCLRQLRSAETRKTPALRHEAQSVKAALAAATHLSPPRSQKPARREEPTSFQLFDEEDVGGWRPGSLQVFLLQDRVPRHSVEQIIENFVLVQILHGPVPQLEMGGVQDQNLQRTAELVLEEVVTVIEVSKFSFQDHIPRRVSLPVPQMVDELVEVPQISLQDCCGGAAHGSALDRCSDRLRRVRGLL